MDKQKLISIVSWASGLNGFLLQKMKSEDAQLVVIAYHRVTEVKKKGNPLSCDDISRIVIDVDAFEQQISWITGTFEVVTLDQVLSGECEKKRAVLITFDDGYKDIINVALPILEKYGCKATVFLTGRHVAEKKTTWIQDIHFLFDNRRAAAYQILGEGRVYDLDNAAALKDCLFEIKRQVLKNADLNFITSLLVDLQKQLMASVPTQIQDILLNDTDIVDLAAKGWTFGCHSYSHLSFSAMRRVEVYQDLKVASESMMDVPGYRPVLALPFGLRNNYDQEIIDIALKLGFKSIFTCQSIPNLNCKGSGVVHRIISETPYFNYFKFIVLNGKKLLSFLPSQ